jgi:hypothetical protein
MAAQPSTSGCNNVFLNVPFDSGYEKLFVAVIATIVAARLTPRCAVEVSERGEGRRKRIIELIQSCPLSIHDLSRAGLPARFNMPFELGIAEVLQHRDGHQFIVLESKSRRLERTLSDLKGVDPLIHRNGSLVLIARLTHDLGGAESAVVESIYHDLMQAMPRLKKKFRVKDVFQKAIFNELVSGALEKAEKLGVFE